MDSSIEQICEDYAECPDLLASIAVMFRESFPVDLELLRTANRAGDAERVGFLAHKLKGSVLAFHLESAAAIAVSIEQLAKAGSLDSAEPLIAELEASFGPACATLERAEARLASEIQPEELP